MVAGIVIFISAEAEALAREGGIGSCMLPDLSPAHLSMASCVVLKQEVTSTVITFWMRRRHRSLPATLPYLPLWLT